MRTYEWLNNYLAQRFKDRHSLKIFFTLYIQEAHSRLSRSKKFQKTLILDLKANSVASQIAILGWYFRALIEYNDYFYDPWKPFPNTFSNCISKQAHTHKKIWPRRPEVENLSPSENTYYTNIKVHQPSS